MDRIRSEDRGAASDDSQEPEERRTATRYRPTEDIPVLFSADNAEIPCAGRIVNLSEGGLRIIAPPTTRAHLYWSDPVAIQASYSKENRRDGLEGMSFRGFVVKQVSNATEYTLHVRLEHQTTGRLLIERYVRRFTPSSVPRAERD